MQLAKIRTEKGMTQAELSQATGITQETISLYETEKQKPFPDNLVKLSEALGVSVGKILGVE